jgi:uncharacterized membrane protein YqiK
MPLFRKQKVVWIRDPQQPRHLIWHIPNEKFPKTKDISDIAVNEHESAALFAGGRFHVLFSAGQHRLPKGVDKIVYVDTSPITEPYGIPFHNGPVTMDNYQVGVSGVLTLRIGRGEEEIRMFLSRIVSGQPSFTSEKLIDWLREGMLVSVFRDIVKKYSLEQFRRLDRARILEEVQYRLGVDLKKSGLHLDSFEITASTQPREFQ